MANPVYCRLPTRRHIRLLSLLPMSREQELAVSVETHLIDVVPQYEALSYVWGEPHCNSLIKCDNTSLAVTESLYCALKHFQMPEEPRLMWIDAVCINQDDLEERSHQVLLMREIYLRACAVLIWLGPGRAHTETAWATLQLIGRNYQEIVEESDGTAGWYNRRELRNAVISDLSTVRPENDASLEIKDLENTDVCSEIHQILHHPWFTRSWVVQEAASAARLSIHCGELSMTWTTLRAVCCFLREQRTPNLLQNAWQAANNMVLLQQTLRLEVDTPRSPLAEDLKPEYATTKHDLRSLLPATRHLLSTDPRDKIFSFLGLCYSQVSNIVENGAHGEDERPDQWTAKNIALMTQGKLQLFPNYSVDVTTLYCVVAKMLLTADLFILSHAGQTPYEGDLPSWVPDWRSKVEMIVLGRVEVALTEQSGGASYSRRWMGNTTGYHPFRASRSRHIKLGRQKSLSVLELQGRYLDTIKVLRNDLWLTDVWDMTGCIVDERLFLEFLQRVGQFMMAEYSPDLAYGASKQDSRWRDEWGTTFRPEQYNGPVYEEQCSSFRPTYPGITERLHLNWPAQGYLQDFLRIQTANLRLSESEFKPGRPGWHYLSEYISPSVGSFRGRPVHITSATSQPMPQTIPPGYFIFAARVRVKRKIFCTTKGYIGICPEWAEPGDCLCVMDGGCVPYVLRPVGEDHFRLIGESYCHGMMSGQIESVGGKKRAFHLV